jgi:hypothetical protein
MGCRTIDVLIDCCSGDNKLFKSLTNCFLGSPAEDVFRFPVPQRHHAVFITKDDCIKRRLNQFMELLLLLRRLQPKVISLGDVGDDRNHAPLPSL